MRPLFHPDIEDVPLEAILHALADPVRVRIFADIARDGCSQSCNAFANVNQKEIPKSTLSQHFRVLREAGLIRSERHGVEMKNSSRCEEVDAFYPGLLSAIATAHQLEVNRQQRLHKRQARKQKAVRSAK